MSYLELAQQAEARQLASRMPLPEPRAAAPPDELDELTKKPPGPYVDVTATLRVAYHRWFTLVVAEADGQPASRVEAHALHQQIVRLTDEAGPLWADSLFTDTLRSFRADTGRCGLCGGLGHPQEDA
jgi:hypothetical protein